MKTALFSDENLASTDFHNVSLKEWAQRKLLKLGWSTSFPFLGYLWWRWGLISIKRSAPLFLYRFVLIGVGGVGVWPGLLKQKVAGSNPVATNPERGALRSQLSWVYAISSGRLSRMIGKPWLRVKWGGSLPKDLESCKGILQLSCKTLVKYQKFIY